MKIIAYAAAAAGLTALSALSQSWGLWMLLAVFAVSCCAAMLEVLAWKGGVLLGSLGAGALLIAAAAGVLGGSLWTAVLAFVIGDVALILLAFAYLLIVCARVDLNVPQAEQDDPFYRKVMYLYIEALLHLAMVKLTVRGTEKTPREGRFLLVCNHIDNPDPPLLLHVFKESQLAFISKKENMTMPIINKFLHKTLCQSIDREDDRQGLRVILKCIQLIREDKVSIGVFPEGYSNMGGRIRHFRPGAFKIAQKAGVPIVVCTIQNTHKVIPNMMRLKSTPVEIHLVDVIPAEELKGVATTEISERVYEMMIADLGEEFRAQDRENT